MSSHQSNTRGHRRGSVTPLNDGRSRGPSVSETKPSSPVKDGKRRTVKHTAPRRAPLYRAWPSTPVIAGLVTAVIAAIGALSVSAGPAPAAGTSAAAAVTAPAYSEATKGGGSDKAATSGLATSDSDLLSGRDQQVSRDSQREALADVVNEDLVEEAEAMSKQRELALSESAKLAEAQAAKIELDEWVSPLSGYRLTAGFGQSSYLWSSVHTGQDLAAPTGTPIRSVANGVVTEAGYDGSYGNKTVVTLEDGTEIWYCHQTSIAVSVGESVTGGELIGTVGSTGNSTGPHLHLEVRPRGGDPIDPMGAMLEHGVRL